MLMVRFHISQTFIFQKEPTQEELKLKIGQWMIDHGDEFAKMIAPHIMVDVSPSDFRNFRDQYHGALDTLGLNHDFHDPERLQTLTYHERDDIEEENIEILKLMIKEYMKPEEAYDFCLLPWIYGSDYSYQPTLDKIEPAKITYF